MLHNIILITCFRVCKANIQQPRSRADYNMIKVKVVLRQRLQELSSNSPCSSTNQL